MFRTLLWLIGAVLLISLLRGVIGIVAKLFSGSESAGRAGGGGRRRTAVPAAGKLIRDPVCGVYVHEAASIKLAEGGQTLHFCSAACRDRYRAGGAQPG
jgi:YHS domain-containing protein